jgi:hypothetical protein
VKYFLLPVDDNELPVTFQLRTMQNGLPTTKVIPFSEITLSPSDINVSNDGSTWYDIYFLISRLFGR